MASRQQDFEDMLSCPICSHRFDMDQRKPKVLPCGHTNCLDCLLMIVERSGKLCPQCRQPFSESPFVMNNNYHICHVLEDGLPTGVQSQQRQPTHSLDRAPSNAASAAVSQRFFCKSCDKDATDNCLVSLHAICDKADEMLTRAKEAREQAQCQFEREASFLKQLSDTLDPVKTAVSGKKGIAGRLDRELQEVKSSMETVNKASKMMKEVPLSLFLESDMSRALNLFLRQNSLRVAALEDQKQMLEMSQKCSLTVTSEEAGVAWGAKLSLDESSAAEERLLVYLVFLLSLNQTQRQREEVLSPSSDGGKCVPSAPFLAGAGNDPRAIWTGKPAFIGSSLDHLIADVKRCVTEGIGLPGTDDEDEDDDEDDSDASSVASEARGLPEVCINAKKLFVSQIPPTARPEEVKGILSKFGKILYVLFLNSRHKEKSKMDNKNLRPIKAIVFVPDDETVSNILKNQPIAYRRNGLSTVLKVQKHRIHRGNAKDRSERRQHRGKQPDPQIPKDEAARKICVRNVPKEVSEIQLKQRFVTYGSVTDVERRPHTKGSEFMAFVTFKDEAAVERVLASLPVKMKDVELKVERYRPFSKSVRPPLAPKLPYVQEASRQSKPQSIPGLGFTTIPAGQRNKQYGRQESAKDNKDCCVM